MSNTRVQKGLSNTAKIHITCRPSPSFDMLRSLLPILSRRKGVWRNLRPPNKVTKLPTVVCYQMCFPSASSVLHERLSSPLFYRGSSSVKRRDSSIRNDPPAYAANVFLLILAYTCHLSVVQALLFTFLFLSVQQNTSVFGNLSVISPWKLQQVRQWFTFSNSSSQSLLLHPCREYRSSLRAHFYHGKGIRWPLVLHS